MSMVRPHSRKQFHLHRIQRGMGVLRSERTSRQLSCGLLFFALTCLAPASHAQDHTTPQAQQVIDAAVQAELVSAQNDHSNWMYFDHDKTADKDVVTRVVETPQGSLQRTVQIGGKPVDAQQRDAETQRLAQFVHDAAEQAKERKNGQHDDNEATTMLHMLPHAFIWTVQAETPEFVTLGFRPDPAFSAPTYEARVLSAMAGTVIVARRGNRIRTLTGTLTQDVKFGFGIFGRLRQGGTFDVERREVAPGYWEITESHVHIDGRALLFKTIGQEEDEVKTEFQASPARTLQDAQQILNR